MEIKGDRNTNLNTCRCLFIHGYNYINSLLKETLKHGLIS